MSRLEQLEQQIAELNEVEMRTLREWFERHDAELWDRQIESDAKSGKLACPYCAHKQEVVADGTVDERDYNEFLARGMQNLQPMANDAMQANKVTISVSFKVFFMVSTSFLKLRLMVEL